MHVYTSTRVEEHKATWRWSNFIVLAVLIFIQKKIGVEFADSIYLLVVGAILGVDVASVIDIAKRVFKK